jgi:Brp/Blh family beta-carotene 15,15'-monooxygenase
MTKLRYTQSYLGVLLCALVIVLLRPNIASSYLLIALALAVVVLGLPHGALDFAVAKSLRLVSSLNSALYFIAGYIALSALAIILWVAYPALGLVLFLAISTYHFSADWRDTMPSYASIGLAAVVICGPAIFYSATLLTLFTALLLSPESAKWIIQSMQLIFAAGLAMFLYFVIGAVQNKPQDEQQDKQTANKWLYAEWVALVISSLVLSPLLHFALYFCLLHSPKHLQDVSATLEVSVRKAIIVSLPFVLLTLLFAVALFKVVGTSELDVTLLRWVFIGLFGLTMSHMLLVTLWHRAAS